MNILIPNSWLKDYLKTDATSKEFAKAMSLTSVSIERLEKVGDDIVFDIEVTTNRPDLMSIEGIAREASAVLPQQGFKAEFMPHTYQNQQPTVGESDLLDIRNDPSLVHRILAVILEVKLMPSPNLISDRLEKTGIRSLNNVVDVTNYIMREVGHPSHVFDYDRLQNHTLIIRKSKKGEKIVTLDGKEHELPGNDIVADNGNGEIVDLLGIMGTANSVVTNETKRVVLFLDNNNPQLLRKTSMNLGIRTEAAILNEKGIDPMLMMPTLLRGIELLKQNANATVISPIIDIFPGKPAKKTVEVANDLIKNVIGIDIPQKTTTDILQHLGFGVTVKQNTLIVTVPSLRNNDIEIPEDIVEEVARVYGYHKIPNILPPTQEQNFYQQDKNEFYWVQKIKQAFLYWGFCETYTYSLVSEEQFEGPIENAVKLKNPLTEDKVYLRNTLTPSLLEVARSNKSRDEIRIFEIANVYIKKGGLPDEVLHLSCIIKDSNATFYDGKGIAEQVMSILGIAGFEFLKKDEGLDGAVIALNGKNIGTIDVDEEVCLEMNLSELLKHASSHKAYKPINKFPPVIEDVRLEVDPNVTFKEITDTIASLDPLISQVSLLDVYKDKKTFRITYLSKKKSLTNEEIAPIRKKIESTLSKKFGALIA